MSTSSTYQRRLGADVQVWRNGDGAMPEWVRQHAASAPEANGTFLVASKVGDQRVHPGHLIIEHCGIAYACEEGEAAGLVDRCRAEAAVLASQTNVGPGKRRAFGLMGGLGRSARTRKGTMRKVPYAPPMGSRPSIEWVRVSDLSVDETYQRRTDNDASRRLIASIAARFDWRLFGVLLVSRRPDGSLKVIDGQHRWSGANMRGDIDQLPCSLSRFETAEEEARFFIVANRARKPMNRLDDFHAALAAADDDALEIQRLVSEAGLSVTRSTASSAWAPGAIAFTAAIARALRMHGAGVVSAALTNISEAFPGQRLGHGGSIFSGLVKIFAHPPEGFDPDRLFRALLAFDADGWGSFMAGLKGGDTRGAAMRQAILEAYSELSDSTEIAQAA